MTLFGESAGGMAVMHHLASPWSAGLFHSAIAQSGMVFDLLKLFNLLYPISIPLLQDEKVNAIV